MALSKAASLLSLPSATVDGSEIRRYSQLRVVVYPIVYKILYIPGGDRRISEPSNKFPQNNHLHLYYHNPYRTGQYNPLYTLNINSMLISSWVRFYFLSFPASCLCQLHIFDRPQVGWLQDGDE